MTTRPIRMVIAGGGTGGHVLPALAVVDELRGRGQLGDLLWIGSEGGVERKAAGRAGIPFRTIQTGKLRRYFSLRTAVDAARVPLGLVQARRILGQFRPTVVFSTGGFVSVPTVVAAYRLAPVLTHEQTAILGLANRINARFAGVLAISYEETAAVARRLHRRVVVTGNPVRSALGHGDVERARQRWGFSAELPLLYVTGGARGASPLNRRIGDLLPGLLDRYQILHQTGPASANRDAAELGRRRAGWPEETRRRYQVVEFVGDELADVYAAADLVIGRAGAGTVAELALLGKPAILVPLPGTGGDEQNQNARLLAAAGGAILLPQSEATPERLAQEIDQLFGDRRRLDAMARAAGDLGRPDAAARLADELIALSAR